MSVERRHERLWAYLLDDCLCRVLPLQDWTAFNPLAMLGLALGHSGSGAWLSVWGSDDNWSRSGRGGVYNRWRSGSDGGGWWDDDRSAGTIGTASMRGRRIRAASEGLGERARLEDAATSLMRASKLQTAIRKASGHHEARDGRKSRGRGR
ncbi:hypothetical protein B0H19DRAFT_1066951 [Mycena capillaripes]|nr:hypothetical protein B0H19DRAFT_1066951 [Mycena capillaripes]